MDNEAKSIDLNAEALRARAQREEEPRGKFLYHMLAKSKNKEDLGVFGWYDNDCAKKKHWCSLAFKTSLRDFPKEETKSRAHQGLFFGL